MPGEKNRVSSCTGERLERVLGRILRIEAERGATFEELLAYSPRLERRLLEMALARLESARAARSTAQDIPAPVSQRVRSGRGRKRVTPAPVDRPALASA